MCDSPSVKLTQEQRERAREKRQKLRSIAQQISKMPESDRAAMVGHWPTTIEGHRVSLHNALMIAFQVGATVIGGFRQWKKAGRHVRKGEHGLGICIPLGLQKKTDDNGDETETGELAGFGVATVFDISQTEASEVVAA